MLGEISGLVTGVIKHLMTYHKYTHINQNIQTCVTVVGKISTQLQEISMHMEVRDLLELSSNLYKWSLWVDWCTSFWKMVIVWVVVHDGFVVLHALHSESSWVWNNIHFSCVTFEQILSRFWRYVYTLWVELEHNCFEWDWITPFRALNEIQFTLLTLCFIQLQFQYFTVCMMFIAASSNLYERSSNQYSFGYWCLH